MLRTGFSRHSLALAVLSATGLSFGAARTVSVSTFNAETGAVELTLTAGDPAEVYAVADKEDKGASIDGGWALTNRLGSVTGDATSFSGSIPTAWKRMASKVRFFLATHPAGNPVAYLTSSAAKSSDATEGSWIDTGYKPVHETVIETWMKGKGNCAPFGYTTWLYFFYNGTNGYSSFFNSSGNFTPPSTIGATFHVWKISRVGAFLDDEVLFSGYVPKAAPGEFSTMALFGRKTAYNGTTLGKMGEVSIGWFKISEGSSVKRDFVAWKKPDGTGCMYDQANGGFYENQNATYPFVC